jgi:hypothetical protein
MDGGGAPSHRGESMAVPIATIAHSPKRDAKREQAPAAQQTGGALLRHRPVGAAAIITVPVRYLGSLGSSKAIGFSSMRSAIRSRLLSVRFRSPRSTPPMYVRWKPRISANAS